MTRKRAFTAVSLTLMLLAWAGLAYMTAPVPGIEKYHAYRVSARDEYFARPNDREALRDGAVMVTFLGTTTLLFDDGQTQFLIDGFLTRPGMLRSMRVRTDRDIVDGDLETAGVDGHRLKAVFVSHSHYDHAMDAPHIVNRYPSAILYGSGSTQKLGCGAAVPAERMRVIAAGQAIALGADGFVVEVLESRHSPHALFEGAIDACLRQPAWNWNYREGPTFSFRVHHGAHTILVQEGARVPLAGGGQEDAADVIFVSTGRLGMEADAYRARYFEDTVTRLRPRLVIPIHWDDFFAPLTPNLTFSMRLADNSPRAFDSLIAQIATLNRTLPIDQAPTAFRYLQGYESVVLFRPKPTPSQ